MRNHRPPESLRIIRPMINCEAQCSPRPDVPAVDGSCASPPFRLSVGAAVEPGDLVPHAFPHLAAAETGRRQHVGAVDHDRQGHVRPDE